MRTLTLIATRVDELSTSRRETDEKLNSIIAILEKQNADSTKMIESIKKGEV